MGLVLPFFVFTSSIRSLDSSSFPLSGLGREFSSAETATRYDERQKIPWHAIAGVTRPARGTPGLPNECWYRVAARESRYMGQAGARTAVVTKFHSRTRSVLRGRRIFRTARSRHSDATQFVPNDVPLRQDSNPILSVSRQVFPNVVIDLPVSRRSLLHVNVQSSPCG